MEHKTCSLFKQAYYHLICARALVEKCSLFSQWDFIRNFTEEEIETLKIFTIDFEDELDPMKELTETIKKNLYSPEKDSWLKP